MRRVCALCFLLGLMLLFTHCAPTPTSPPTPTSDLGLHLLVEAVGDLTHKRPEWGEPLPLSFGVPLDRDDLIQAASDAKGLIACANLSLVEVPPGYHGGLPCPREAPLLTRGDSLLVGPRRDAAPASSIPYVLSPRHTFIQTDRPLLRWNPSATPYTVRVWGGALDWQAESATAGLRYPEDAPPLEAGVPYHLTVTDASGSSSDEERAALDLSFVLLSSEEMVAVQAVVAQAHGLGLADRATHLLEAEIYATHGLRADAIALLEELAAGLAVEDAPTVHRRLGDLYLEVGLYTESREACERALGGYRALKDRAGEAAALAGLGLAHRGDGDDATARGHLEQARDLYQTLGDVDGVARVEDVLAEMGK